MSAAAPPARTGRAPFAIVLTLTLVVFAVVVAFVTLRLRSQLREQILRHEGDSLAAVAAMQLANEAKQVGLIDLPGGLVDAVLRTSELRGVFAMRVFDRARQFVNAVPWVWSEAPPALADWASLDAGRSLARLHRRDALGSLGGVLPELKPGEVTVPLLEIWVPLRRGDAAQLLGGAQFWIDGNALDREFRELDLRLAAQATGAWLAGAIVIGTALVWAFRRLEAANRELLARSDDLQRANRELVLAAKTSALGTVTAHLLHALKNPVAGLELFVANQAESGGRDDGGDELAAAGELTRRLRTMINDVVAVLHDEQHGAHFELTPAEIVELALAKAQPTAAQRGVRLRTQAASASTQSVAGRRGSLASLVLQNLLQNAAEAASAGSEVTITSRDGADAALEFIVEDSGPGLPEAVRARLFQPCASSKAGGSGLGLALSHQLAQQAGGRLELLRSDAGGTCFRLVLPLER